MKWRKKTFYCIFNVNRKSKSDKKWDADFFRFKSRQRHNLREERMKPQNLILRYDLQQWNWPLKKVHF